MNDGQPGLLLALTPVAERAIEHLLFGEATPATPVASVGEADELEASVREHSADAALISPQLSGLSTGHCERVRAAGVRLVGVALDEHDRHALETLAIDAIITPNADAGDLLAAIHGERERQARPVRSVQSEVVGRARHPGEGTALAVIGAHGAGGASECAASLAALASNGWSTLLVELDALGGSLALRVGSDPHQGSVLGLIRAAEAGEEVVPELLERWITTATGWPRVLLGPAHGDPTLGALAAPGAIATACDALRCAFPLSVWDVGWLLSAGGEVVTAARVHREAIVAADSVLLVLGASDLHLQAGLAQLDLLLEQLEVPAERLRILVNGVGAPGTPSEKALVQALSPKLAERGLTADAWLPWDARALGRASRTGLPLAAARPRGAYARALSRLLGELFLPDSIHTRRRKIKLAVPTAVRSSPRELRDARDDREPGDEEEVWVPWRS